MHNGRTDRTQQDMLEGPIVSKEGIIISKEFRGNVAVILVSVLQRSLHRLESSLEAI